MKSRFSNPLRSSVFLFTATFVLGGLTASSAFAYDVTWTGGSATSGQWNVDSWANFGGNAANVSGQNVFFGSANTNGWTLTSLGGGRTLGSLTFQAGSAAYDIRLTTGITSSTAANLTFNSTNTGITVEAGDTSSHTIGITGGNVVLQGNLTVTHNGSGTLTIDRPITGSGFGVTKTGSGLMKLEGANAYTGATQVNGGILSFGSLAAYGSTSGVSVGASGTVGLGVGSTGTTTHYEFADLVSLFNTNSLAGFNLNATSGVAIDTSASSFSVLNQSGGGPNAALTGTRSLTKIGTKTLQLNLTNTYTGATIIKEGGLNVGAGLNGGKLSPDSTITVESGASFGVNLQRNAAQGTDFSSAPITGGGGFEQLGSGITTLNAANSYTGSTTVAGGMLKYEGGASLALTSGNLIVGGGGVVGLSENLTRGRGTGSNQIQWNGSGGFAAIGADRTVSLDGGGNVQWNSGNFVPAGGSLILGHEAATHTVIFTNNINFAGGSRTIEVGDGAAAIDAVVSGTLGLATATNGSFTKAGAGTLELSNTNTYTGTTTVANGTLIVNGSISSSSLTTVGNGATLGGSGSVGALTIDVGGTLSPGNSPGILTVGGDYTQNGTLSIELNGTTAGALHDQVDVAGSVTLNGLLAATVGYTPAPSDLLFVLLNDGADAVTGTFTGLAQGDTVNLGGFDWMVSYTADSVGGTILGGNDVALMAVPEPRAALIGSFGLLSLLRRRRA